MADWLTALKLALGYVGLWLLLVVAVWTVVAILRRLPCAFGWHRRETVRSDWQTDHGFRVVVACLDCPHTRPLYEGKVFTPSRRYALRQPKQGRAA